MFGKHMPLLSFYFWEEERIQSKGWGIIKSTHPTGLQKGGISYNIAPPSFDINKRIPLKFFTIPNPKIKQVLFFFVHLEGQLNMIFKGPMVPFDPNGPTNCWTHQTLNGLPPFKVKAICQTLKELRSTARKDPSHPDFFQHFLPHFPSKKIVNEQMVGWFPILLT